MLAGDPLVARVSMRDRALAVDDRRPPLQGPHPRLLEQRPDAGREPRDDPVLPGDRFGEVERRGVEGQADRVQGKRIGQRMRRIGGVDDRLRGNAADMQTGAAELSVLDEHGVEAELSGADRRDIAAGAPADDENLAAKLGHIVP